MQVFLHPNIYSSNTLFGACKLRIVPQFCLKQLSVLKRNSFHLTFTNTFYCSGFKRSVVSMEQTDCV